MSAIHTGSIAARLRNDGLYEYTGKSEDRIITDWSALGTGQHVHVTIPAQRAGSAYEQTVLTAGDDLADLSDLVPIPQLGTFAHEYLSNDQATQEGNAQ